MKPLYTIQEFEIAKSKDKLACECYVCKTMFFKTKADIQKVLNKISGFAGKYCSYECQSLDRTSKREVECSCCKTVFLKTDATIKQDANFCSKSCAAKVNNSKRAKSKHKCTVCQSRTFGKEKICTPCKMADKIKEWELGNLNLSTKFGHSNLVRTYLLKKYDSKCSKCDFSGMNEKTGNSILHVDHIDGDWTNSTFGNVRLLCPNCHAMTSTYGSLNRGNGRKWKSKYSIHKN